MPQRVRARLQTLPFPPLRDLVGKRPSTGRNLDALDGVRGLALVLVVASHAGAFGMQGHGAVGVWLFFTLSAFLLTMPFAIAPERLRDPASLRHYAVRRVRRIVPPYYLFLLFELAVGGDVYPILRHAIFVQGDLHLWSIPQEVYFYALLPLLAALHPLVFRRSFGWSALGLLAAALAAERLLDASIFSLRANGMDQRFFLSVFLCGMAASYAYRWPPLVRVSTRPGVRRVLGPLGLAALASLVLTAPAAHGALAEHFESLGALAAPLGWYYPVGFGIASALLILVALLGEGSVVQRLFSSLPLRAIGIVSYSAYLVHLRIIEQLERLGLERGVVLFAAALVVTYALASVSYTLVERPFLVIRQR